MHGKIRITSLWLPLFILMAEIYFTFFFPVLPAHGFNLNCGTDFVSEGDSKIKVLKTCGEPMYQEVVGTIQQKFGFSVRELIIEHWYYTETWRGSSEDMVLIFHGSKLVKIERADGRF